MECGNVPAFPIRIGDLPSLFKNIPEEVSNLDETEAISTVNETFLSLTANQDLVDQLQQDCSLTNLFIPDDHASLDCILNVQPTRNAQLGQMELKTLSSASQESLTRFRALKPVVDLSFRNVADDVSPVGETLNDIMVTVMVHRPLPFSKVDIASRSRYLICTQRLVCLASQKLSDLKDAIRCPQDKIWLGDCSDALNDMKLHISADKLYTSSSFFIETTFYDDTRISGSNRISEPVLKWVKGKAEFEQMGKFSWQPMEGTTLADLVVTPGKPYFYIHQGNCEHVIIFSDIRLSDRDSCQSRDAFPILTGRCLIRALRCTACRRLCCRWIVYNAGNLLPTEPCPLCDVCLRMLVYNENGGKISPDIRVHMFCGEEVIF